MGRLLQEKGILTLLEAFCLLSKEHDDWNLLIVGSGKYKITQINYVNEKKLRERVEFRDSVSHETVEHIFH